MAPREKFPSTKNGFTLSKKQQRQLLLFETSKINRNIQKFSVNDDKIELIFKANLDNEKNLEEIELALKNLNITDNFSLSEELIIN